MQKPDYFSEFPLAERPYLRGVARLFDFTGRLDRSFRESVQASYKRERLAIEAETAKYAEEVSRPGHLRDAEAIAADWKRVGDSLRSALNDFDKISRKEIKT